MTLANLLTPEQVVPRLRATDRWSAIVELVEVLVDAKRIQEDDKENVLASLRQREETMSTGIGFGIAIPHAQSDCVKEVVAAFGRSPGGIEFEALDNAPVKFIVLFVVPKNEFQVHLRTLAAIAKLLNDKAVREALAGAEDAPSILRIFENRAGKTAAA